MKKNLKKSERILKKNNFKFMEKEKLIDTSDSNVEVDAGVEDLKNVQEVIQEVLKLAEDDMNELEELTIKVRLELEKKGIDIPNDIEKAVKVAIEDLKTFKNEISDDEDLVIDAANVKEIEKLILSDEIEKVSKEKLQKFLEFVVPSGGEVRSEAAEKADDEIKRRGKADVKSEGFVSQFNDDEAVYNFLKNGYSVNELWNSTDSKERGVIVDMLVDFAISNKIAKKEIMHLIRPIEPSEHIGKVSTSRWLTEADASENTELPEAEEDVSVEDSEVINEKESKEHLSEIMIEIDKIFQEGIVLTEALKDPSVYPKPHIHNIMFVNISNIRVAEIKHKDKISEADSAKIDLRIKELCYLYNIEYENVTRESVQVDIDDYEENENDVLTLEEENEGETESEKNKREYIEHLKETDPVSKAYYESSPEGKREKVEDGKRQARNDIEKEMESQQRVLGDTVEKLAEQRKNFQESMKEAHKNYEEKEKLLHDICKTEEFKNLNSEQKKELKEVMSLFGKLAKSHIDLAKMEILEEEMLEKVEGNPETLLDSYPSHDNTIRTWENVMKLINEDIEDIMEDEEKVLIKWFDWIKNHKGEIALLIAAIVLAGGAGAIVASHYGAGAGMSTFAMSGVAGVWASTKATMVLGIIKAGAIVKTGATIGAIGGLAAGLLALTTEKQRDSFMEWWTGKSVPAWCRVGQPSKS